MITIPDLPAATTTDAAKDTVISLNRFRNRQYLSPIRQAEAYWCALRDGASVPLRSQIDPRGLENILQYTFILERIAPGIARFRLAGQHLFDLMGMDVRGMPLSAFFTPSGRARIGEVLEHVLDTPAVAELTLSDENQGRRPVSSARMILLPLCDERGDVSRIMGVLVADDCNRATRPVRFDLSDRVLRPVAGQQIQACETEKTNHGFAETQKPLTGVVPHLRLVD